MAYHDTGDVRAAEPTDGGVETRQNCLVDSLSQQPVDVNASAQQVHLALAHQRGVPIWGRVMHMKADLCRFGSEALVQQQGRSVLLVVAEDLSGQFEHELIKRQVGFCFDLVIEKTTAEREEGTSGRVVIKIQRV